ncbi:MAG TPA: hypothetical protein VK507_24800 [Iamia sp.]|nr:hypothetical protein [Iamia sp.]
MTVTDPTPVAGRPARPRLQMMAVAALAAVLAVLSLAPGGAPAGAGDNGPCDVPGPAEQTYVCDSYYGLVSRPPSAAELEYWAGRVPAQRTLFISTLAKSAEGRRYTVLSYYQRFVDGSPSDADIVYWSPLVTAPNGLRKLEAALLASIDLSTEAWVEFAYSIQLFRTPGPFELAYWSDRADATTRNKVAAELSNTLEVRRARVTGVYNNDLGVDPDEPGRAYWAERLRTGTLYLDVRIALRSTTTAYANPSPCSAAAAPVPTYYCAG